MALSLTKLIDGVSKEPIRRVFKYQGQEVEFYSKILTLKERDKVKKAQRDSDDANEFALRLLISKAVTKDGKRMFQDGQYAELLNEWPIAALESAMLLIMREETGEANDEADPK